MQPTPPPPASSARHPFRRAMMAGFTEPARTRDEEDIRLFALSFAAFFICFYTFLL